MQFVSAICGDKGVFESNYAELVQFKGVFGMLLNPVCYVYLNLVF